MLKWDHLTTLKTCLNEPAEVHAFVLGGLSNIFCLIDIPEKNKKEIKEEYPYFMTGKFLGLMIILGVIWIVIS